MNKIIMTKHAIEQWRKRIDDNPPSDVTKLLGECVMVQNRRLLYTTRGREYKVLALYWHPKRRIFFKVDKFCVVTVLSENTILPGRTEPFKPLDRLEPFEPFSRFSVRANNG